MFSRLSGFVTSAVEVLAPQILRRDEAFRGHWAHISAYYERHFGPGSPAPVAAASDVAGKDGVKVPVSSNIAYHLDHLVKYVKEEECELGDETGPCLEYLLERRILDTLVEYATLDAPPGMRNQVLKAFSLLISNVRARLLPEAAVRVPLQTLIELCHRALAAEGEAADPEMTEELVKLVHTVFRNLRGQPELMVLFCDPTGPRGDDSGQAHARFYIFSVLLDYIAVPGRISRIAREAAMLAVQIAALPGAHPTVSEYLAYESHFCETMTERLGVLYSVLPTWPAPLLPETSEEPPPGFLPSHDAQSRSRSAANMGSDESSANESSAEKLTAKEKALNQFFSFFQFVNDVSAAGDEILARYLNESFRTNFSDPICARVRADRKDEQIEQFTIYMTEIIRSCNSSALLRTLLSSLLGVDSKGGTPADKDDCASGPRRKLVGNMAAPRESLSIATLRLFDAILGSGDQRGIERLVMSSLTGKAQKEPLSGKKLRTIVKRILLLLPEEDGVLTISSTSTYGDVMKAGGFDDYLIDAQERRMYTLAVSAAVNGRALDGDEEAHDQPGSPPVHSQPLGSSNLDAEAGLFLDVLLGGLESVTDKLSVERSLLITALLARTVALPNREITSFVYSDVAGSRTIYGVLRAVAQELTLRSQEVPNFAQKVSRLRATGLRHQASGGNADDLDRRISARRTGSPGRGSGAARRPSQTPTQPRSPAHEQEPQAPQQPEPRQHDLLASVYIVIQEFCKELAATLFVKSAQAAGCFEPEADSDEDEETALHHAASAPATPRVGPPPPPGASVSSGGVVGAGFLRRFASSSLTVSSTGLPRALSDHFYDAPSTLLS